MKKIAKKKRKKKKAKEKQKYAMEKKQMWKFGCLSVYWTCVSHPAITVCWTCVFHPAHYDYDDDLFFFFSFFFSKRRRRIPSGLWNTVCGIDSLWIRKGSHDMFHEENGGPLCVIFSASYSLYRARCLLYHFPSERERERGGGEGCLLLLLLLLLRYLKYSTLLPKGHGEPILLLVKKRVP